LELVNEEWTFGIGLFWVPFLSAVHRVPEVHSGDLQLWQYFGRLFGASKSGIKLWI